MNLEHGSFAMCTSHDLMVESCELFVATDVVLLELARLSGGCRGS